MQSDLGFSTKFIGISLGVYNGKLPVAEKLIKLLGLDRNCPIHLFTKSAWESSRTGMPTLTVGSLSPKETAEKILNWVWREDQPLGRNQSDCIKEESDGSILLNFDWILCFTLKIVRVKLNSKGDSDLI